MSFIYKAAIDRALGSGLGLTTNNVYAIIVDNADYTPNEATHSQLSDVPAAARVATSPNLTGKSVSGGVFDAADVTISDVSGDPTESLVIVVVIGGTHYLVAYIDSGTTFTPNGSDLNIVWNNGADKIIKVG